MTHSEQKKAAAAFVKKWTKKDGNEMQETGEFWRDLLQLYGIYSTDYIKFEQPSLLETTKRIDAVIPATKVLIEQKSKDIDLTKKQRQSDGTELTPFEQANRYVAGLGTQQIPDWIIVCNFSEFHIYDRRESVNRIPVIIKLKDLPNHLDYMRQFLDVTAATIKHETERSKQAWEIVKGLYNALAQQYVNPESDESKKNLNKLCVRLVFCFYADSAEIFGARHMLYNYLKEYSTKNIHYALVRLFMTLDTPEDEREPYLDDDLDAFPYVNGGLFADSEEELKRQIPRFTEECRTILLDYVNSNFEWSEISPTIFGAIFESTLNDDTRRTGGMHYTSIENIHKVIDPLFLDDLKAELREILASKQRNKRRDSLEAYRKKLGALSFLDPACGSGNFLTLTYTELRELENEALRQELLDSSSELSGQIRMSMHFDYDPIQVKLSNFYGIEINDFAVAVAKTALWIAESQMWEKTRLIYADIPNIIPLTSLPNIVEANALRLDWNEVVPKERLSYIISNPPFVGASRMTAEQKQEAVNIYGKIKLSNSLDYVCAWYFKSCEYIVDTNIRVALVSTNSITQGEMVAPLWKTLFQRYDIQIDFAYHTFRWDNETKETAKVHCVIIGFGNTNPEIKPKLLFTKNGCLEVRHINPYLFEGPDIIVESVSKPICNVPAMRLGNKPTDYGKFILTKEEMENILEREPNLKRFIRLYTGAEEYINGNYRYCLWLTDAKPQEIKSSPELMRRVDAVRELRGAPDRPEPTRKKAETPHLFFYISQPSTNYLIIPSTSSENRKYIPIGFMSPDIIASNATTIISDATLFHFGVLTSSIHMIWVRMISGRLKSDYRYSNGIAYNPFPWCIPTQVQRNRIEQTAQAILDARAMYPDSSLADLYDATAMVAAPKLSKAHAENDMAVMDLYGFKKTMTEQQIVIALLEMYKKLTEGEQA